MPDPAEVRSMFARIAGRYDLLNHVLSVGIDRRWRARAIERASGPGEQRDLAGKLAIDACCGTGDLTLALARAGAHTIGVDFTREMLERALPKGDARHLNQGGRVAFAQGDALRLPVPDDAADMCTVAFGIRNVADRAAGLREMARVVKPGGRVVVLEFTTPPGAVLRRLYGTYFTRVLPCIGRLVSRDAAAYSYLPRTVLAWPGPDAFERELEQAGLVDCGHELLTRGIACLHWGSVPRVPSGSQRNGKRALPAPTD